MDGGFILGFLVGMCAAGALCSLALGIATRRIRTKIENMKPFAMTDAVPDDHPDPEGRPGALNRIVRTTVQYANSSNIFKIESGWNRNDKPLTMAESGVLNVICGIRDLTRAGYTVDEIDVSMMETLGLMANRREKKAKPDG